MYSKNLYTNFEIFFLANNLLKHAYITLLTKFTILKLHYFRKSSNSSKFTKIQPAINLPARQLLPTHTPSSLHKSFITALQVCSQIVAPNNRSPPADTRSTVPSAIYTCNYFSEQARDFVIPFVKKAKIINKIKSLQTQQQQRCRYVGAMSIFTGFQGYRYV